MMNNLLSALKFDENGLICTIAQDYQTQRVLMVAWADKAAIAKTIETGLAHYYSRSRQKMWCKGEESGHFQKVKEMRTDCDGDTLLLKIEQTGGIACHTGRESCFYKIWQENQWLEIDPVIKNPAEIY
ncbi:MAG: phosphoribosyl-AMP cyclohydrolase [Neisseriaceae bacterium]|nr:phosphoribosyl-AMP cyclohydrolase [Neisseriaceae bacterium]MBO7554386.1 phosphoribosyl-AMP cyclohydrolase [Neisseriaceae bacterium]MBP5788945.1 phosphoribosyl-AMP cyclohydrolase [Neisseriaceae bacterium]MBQ5429452.1 phosphoribosyl-AMP cyclohydrolase [Neisseriaceae bacterium]